jgi:heat shock protein HtpX
MNIYHEQSRNVWKTWFLMTFFFVVVIVIGYVFALAWDNSAILIFAIIFSIFMNILSYWFSDKIVLSMYRAQAVTNESHPDLYNIVENLSITAGLPMPKVYVIPDPAPNAFATGRNKDHAAVAVTSGLLDMLDRTELEGVIAHELSHIGNRDILLSTVVIVLVGFVSLISHMFIRSSMWGGISRRDDREGGSGIFVIIGLIFAILSPIAVTLIQLAISRKREYLADASGALLTRYPEGLASALEKIGSYSGQLRNANNATAHLFISNPFGNKKLATLFATHPAIEERIAILRGQKI